MEYIIGVDAGGTRTTAASFDLQGNLLEKAVSGHGNVTVDLEAGTRNIIEAISSVMEQTPGKCVFLCPGVAGVETSNRRELLMTALKKRFDCETVILNDAQIALMSLFEGGDGVLCIAGTGSITYGKKGDTYYRCGGYGHVASDEGSAYYLAVQAIREVFRLHDQGIEDDPLSRRIFGFIGSDNIRDLVEFVNTRLKGEIAAAAPEVAAAAQEGSAPARKALTLAGQALADKADILLTRMNVKAPGLALSGSVVTHVEEVRSAFLQAVWAKHPDVVLNEKENFVPKGAYYQYLAGHE